MRARSALALHCLGLLCVGLLSGCGSLVIDQEAFEAAAPQRIAILPFVLADEDSMGKRAHEKVVSIRGVFARRFASTAYLSLRPEEVDRRLRSAGFSTPAEIAALPTARLGELLGVDALLIGTIETLANFEGLLLYRQKIGGSLELIDAKSGRELVRVEHTQMDIGGMLLEFSQSLEAVQHTLDNSSDLGFVRLAEKFADSLVSQLPPPPVPIKPAQPILSEVELKASSEGVLRAGAGLEVLVRADPGLRGFLVLGRGKRVPLLEEEPGVYRGHYDVVGGDLFQGAMSVLVEDAFGNGTSKILREHQHPIDARPPTRPGKLAAKLQGDSIYLSWIPCEVVPAVAYQVYSLSAQGIPTLLAKVKTLTARVTAKHSRYAVAGLDAEGNLGRLAVVGSK